MSRFLHVLPAACLFLVAACDQPTQPTAATPEPALRSTESFRDFGDYVVHFNAISTNQLTPDIARQYGIVRSDSRAMLNVSIIRKEAGTIGRAVPGSVAASAVNLTGQHKNLTLREINEGDAVYYIGELPVANEETLVFSIDVTPMNESSRFSVRYMKQFYVN